MRIDTGTDGSSDILSLGAKSIVLIKEEKNRPIARPKKYSQRVVVSTMLLLFSAFLIFFDNEGAFIEGIPPQTIVVIELLMLSLIPLYLRRIRVGYIVGMLVAGFVAFSYRGEFFGPAIPILSYFLAFFSLLAYIESRRILQSYRGSRR